MEMDQKLLGFRFRNLVALHMDKVEPGDGKRASFSVTGHEK